MGLLQSATTIIGEEVWNDQGDRLGTIRDLMIDTESGEIEYAVLSFGGFLGMGEKYFAIPWRGFTVDKASGFVLLDVHRKILETAPGFDRDDWPDMADPRFRKEIYSHYGYEQNVIM